jgi:hypothetical protein
LQAQDAGTSSCGCRASLYVGITHGAEASVSHCQQQTTVAGNKLIDTHELHMNEFLFVGLICTDE